MLHNGKPYSPLYCTYLFKSLIVICTGPRSYKEWLPRIFPLHFISNIDTVANIC